MNARLIDKAVYHLMPSSSSPEEDAIPASRLEDILHGLNDIIRGLADRNRDSELDERAKSILNSEEKEHYVLYLRPAIPGSFAVPIELYDTRESDSNQDPIFPGYEISFQQVANLIQLANSGNRDEFYSQIKSPVVAHKIEKGIEKIAPYEGEKAELSFDGEEKPPMPISNTARENVIEWQAICEGPFRQELVVSISSIDFDDGLIRVKLPAGRKKYKVPISSELKQIKLEEFPEKKWVILCDVLYTPNGMISEIQSVHDIHELALREFSIKSFTVEDKTIKLHPPIVAKEMLDEDTGSLFVVKIPKLDIMVFSDDQSDIQPLLYYELANKWNWIVCAPDRELTPRALEVKAAFRALVESEVDNLDSTRSA